MTPALLPLLRDVRACRLCEDQLEHGVRPVLRASTTARILVAGQAPGRRVHASGLPFDDPSGDRLRDWMGVTKAEFYDESRIAIVPMGFCFPGTGSSGDLPPIPLCAQTWRRSVLDALPRIELTLAIGSYAIRWHLKTGSTKVGDVVRAWRDHAPAVIPTPHPSPRNTLWLKRHPFFEDEVLPYLRRAVQKRL